MKAKSKVEQIFTEAVTEALYTVMRDNVAPVVLELLLAPTHYWKHKPDIKCEVKIGKYEVHIIAKTESKIYQWVNRGVERHNVYPRKRKLLRYKATYIPSTEPDSLRSFPPASGRKVIFARRSFPGIRARMFTKAAVEALPLPKLLRNLRRVMKPIRVDLKGKYAYW
ncbi:hypothetical protein [Thermogutta sp.]|uniref:hypothetical protein n=1 Tax=Thermogutta sp. TaxID=1962930 RepID=UPI0032208B74